MNFQNKNPKVGLNGHVNTLFDVPYFHNLLVIMSLNFDF